MNKNKHSKFKNSGIIFELLMRQITADTLSNKESHAMDILKKYYTKNSELHKEYKLYSILSSSKNLTESKGEMLINSVLEASKKINRSQLRKEKYNLIKEIKNYYNINDFFKSKINNYKALAAIYNLVESHNSPEFTSPSFINSNKDTLIGFLTEVDTPQPLNEYDNEDKEIRLLAYKLLVEKFNEKYKDFSSDQKEILTLYIKNVSNTNNLKEYVNKKQNAIKKEIKSLLHKVQDPATSIKLNEVLNILEPIGKTQNVKDDHVLNLLQYYQLINDLKSL